MYRRVASIVFAVLPISTLCTAEVQVTVSISGSVAEMAEVLQQLQELGIGGGPDEEGIQLEVNSIASGATMAAPAAPELALKTPTLNPPELPETGRVMVMVDVLDTARVVDTLSAQLSGSELGFDLYDNGMNGDLQAADGVWSAVMQAPQDLAPGIYPIVISAYDANGQPIGVPAADGSTSPLSIQTELTVLEKP